MGWHRVKATAVKPGDIATHRNGQLDSRRVTRVEGSDIWLELLVSGKEHGPFPRRNYVFERHEED